MIKINLLPAKRGKVKAARPGARRGVSGGAADDGGKHMLFGVLGLVGAAALVFFVFDMPKRNAIADAKERQKALQRDIAKKEADETLDLKSYDTIVASEAAAIKKIQQINKLLDNRVVPANMLHELGLILSSRGPTQTTAMSNLTRDKGGNKTFQSDWDPTHVWLSAFKDNAGSFTLEGGAQSKEDVTQLAKRLAASVYFADVTPSGGERVVDRDTGISYFKFTITGKVVY